jgi:hypothetical protein
MSAIQFLRRDIARSRFITTDRIDRLPKTFVKTLACRFICSGSGGKVWRKLCRIRYPNNLGTYYTHPRPCSLYLVGGEKEIAGGEK